MTVRAGLSLPELLLALAIAALLSAGLVVLARPSQAWSAARGLRGLLLWARIEALLGGSPMAFRYDPAARAFLVWRGASCGAGGAVRRLRLAEYPGVRLRQELRDGLLWLPSGAGRDCGGGGVFNGTLVLADGHRSVRLIVARTGRIRLEAVP